MRSLYIKRKKPRLLNEAREVMRLPHYSIHTERNYSDWIKRFVYFHQMKSRKDIDQKNILFVKQNIHSFPTPDPEKESNYPESERNLSLAYSKHTTPAFIFFKQKTQLFKRPASYCAFQS